MSFQLSTGVVCSQNRQVNDPYWNNVRALLHMNGAHLSTTFTDQKAHVFGRTGNPFISTSQSKFGGASGYFNGTSYVSSNNTDFQLNQNNFTVEFWMRPEAQTAEEWQPILVYFTNGGLWIGRHFNDFVVRRAYVTDYILTSYPAIGAWTHVCFERAGNIGTLYMNGVSVGSFNFAGLSFSGTQPIIGGDSVTPLAYQGFIDDFRLTVGVARYGGPFTPPTQEFPDQ